MAIVFFSYSHMDEQLRDALEKHLSTLKRQGIIESWHDRRIFPGQHVDQTIDQHLEAADIILLLVSADFLASEYCYDIEVRRAMERHERAEVTMIPVILRPCDWHGAPFGRLLALPRDARPVTSWPNQDEAFLSIAEGIRRAATAGPGSVAIANPVPTHPSTTRGTGSDRPYPDRFRIPRTFSDLDRDNFLEEAFHLIAASFENFLPGLERENPAVRTRFRRLDANRMTAVAYRDGRPVSRCTIWMGTRATFMRGIGYLENDSGETNAFNESLSVESDEHSLYLKPLGMAFAGRANMPAKLSAEAAADFLWELFLRRLREGT